MNCKMCNSPLDANGYCPVCGWNQALDNNQPNAYNQQISNQQMPNQQMPNQQYYAGNRQIPNQQYYDGNRQMPNQQMPNQQMPNQQYYAGNRQMPNQQMPNQQFSNQQMTNRQVFQQPVNNNNIPSNYKPTKKKKTWPIFAGIAAGVLVIAGTISAVILSKPEKDLTKDSKKTTEVITEVKTTESTTERPETTEAINAEAGSKTIMIYMVGSNLESDYGAATNDINEMIDSDINTDKVNLIIYTGGCKDWDTPNIPSDSNAAFQLIDGELKELYSDPKKNMGDPSTLSDFINYCYSSFPAEEYGLILWNHGGGAFFGYGLDENTNDSLTLTELREAFDATSFKDDNKLDWLGFDACLMGNIETAKVLSPYADYLIASQEPEPGWGWDYSFLSDIDGLSGGAAIGESVVDTYIDCSENEFGYNPFAYTDVTLSVLDLSKIDNVESSLNALFALADQNLDAANYRKYSSIRKSTKEIATMFKGDESYDIVDLKDLAIKSKSEFPGEATALEAAVDELIVYSDSNAENANGVSIYYPYNAKQYAPYYLAMYSDFNFATDYTKYINDFGALLCGDSTSSANWDVASLMPYLTDGTNFAVDLTPEQVSECQNAYYVISRADTNNEGKVLFVAMSTDTSLEASGTLKAKFDGNVIYVQNQTTGDLYEAMYTLQEKTADYTRYLISCALYNNSIEDEDAVTAYLVLEVTPSNPAGTILGAYPIDNIIAGGTEGDALFPDRYEINVNDYNYIAFGQYSHEYAENEDLNNINNAQWADLQLYYNEFPVSDGFTTVKNPMLPGIPYFGMFIIEDMQGNYHSTGLVQIQ